MTDEGEQAGALKTKALLGKLTGMSEEKLDELWKEVQKNAKRLDECEGAHDFIAVPPAPDGLQREYICKKCNGIIRSLEWLWYTRGLEHGRKE